jgi:hypothetical protein
MKKGLGPMTFNGLRFALGCLSLIPFILWRKKYAAAATDDECHPSQTQYQGTNHEP